MMDEVEVLGIFAMAAPFVLVAVICRLRQAIAAAKQRRFENMVNEVVKKVWEMPSASALSSIGGPGGTYPAALRALEACDVSIYHKLHSAAAFREFDWRQAAERDAYERKDRLSKSLNQYAEAQKLYFKYARTYSDLYRRLNSEIEQTCKLLYGSANPLSSSIHASVLVYMAPSQLPMPSTPTFKISWGYISPQGRKRYRDERSFDLFHWQILVQTYSAKIVARETEITEERAKEEFVKTQRGLVTPGLRFQVMRRDGYRCQLCGRRASDGVVLEVDHKVPISRGGRSTLDNLWTLCRDCNRGKSDKEL